MQIRLGEYLIYRKEWLQWGHENGEISTNPVLKEFNLIYFWDLGIGYH